MRTFATGLTLALVGASQTAFAAPGSLDPTFGSGGIATTNFGAAASADYASMALQPNGDIVAATSFGFGPSSVGLVRFLPSGALDPSFGTGGLVTETFQNSANYPFGMVIQPNGQIVLQAFADNTSGSVVEILLSRFDANGSLDTSFASGGVLPLTYPAPAPYSASPITTVLEANGDFLVVFSLTPPFRNKSPDLTALARYTANGALDPTFGSGGQSVAEAIGGIPVGLSVLSNGDALVVTSTNANAEFGPTGTLLSSVSPGTVVAGDLTFPMLLPPTTFLSNSDYLLLTSAQGPLGRQQVESVVRRYLPNGTLDTTFQSPLFDFAPSNRQLTSIASALTVAPNGQILVAGEATSSSNTSIGYDVARLNSTGAIDTTFGNAGIATTAFAGGGSATFVLVQPDEKVLALGTAAATSGGLQELTLVRYLGQ